MLVTLKMLVLVMATAIKRICPKNTKIQQFGSNILPKNSSSSHPATLMQSPAKVKVNEYNIEIHDSEMKPRGVTASLLLLPPHQDWGEAIGCSVFYGRTAELD